MYMQMAGRENRTCKAPKGGIRHFRPLIRHASHLQLAAYLVDRIGAKGLHAEVNCLFQAFDSAKQLDPNIPV